MLGQDTGRRGGGMSASSWGVLGTGPLTHAAGGTGVERGWGTEMTIFLEETGLFSLANEA